MDDLVIAEHLTKDFAGPEGTLRVLDDINFTVARGTSCAIVGTSGSGKSTLLGLLAGLEVPTAGRCLIDGQDLGALDEDARARLRNARVGFVFQQFHLLHTLTAEENVMLPLELAGRRDARQTARMALARVGLDSRAGHLPRQLSGGEQQRVALARAFVSEPALLLADEPTGNVDTATSAEIMSLLDKLNSEEGLTIILITHEQEVADHAQRQLFLRDGQLEARV